MIKYLIIDVDGTLTDGGIYYDNHDNELKKFNTKDAYGFYLAKQNGIKTIVVTGRECGATVRRIKDVAADELYQNIKDKKEFLEKYMLENHIKKEEIGYIGDDVNDLESMKLVGFVGCPYDACKHVKEIANYVSSINGGDGAVRDCMEYLLDCYD